MADVQKYFRQFDDEIRLERDDEKAKLVEKRDRVLKRLSDGLKRQRDAGAKIPSYVAFNQGSYAMNVGVKPIDGDFDIDVGLRFDLATTEQPDPGVVKTWVYDAVKNHTKKVEMRRGCVTVFYQEGGEDIYHVDLVCYSSKGKNSDGKDYIARGKPGNCEWVASDPQELQDLISSQHKDEDGAQFRRVIRALKRWKDIHFSRFGRKAPKGIALTVAAYRWYRVSKVTDPIARTVKYDDLDAMKNLVERMVNAFSLVWSEEAKQLLPRLQIPLPIAPASDLCDNLSDASMSAFKDRLDKLLAALKKAKEDVDPHTACKELSDHFGSDFPVPEKSETAQPRGKAITSSGNSA